MTSYATRGVIRALTDLDRWDVKEVNQGTLKTTLEDKYTGLILNCHEYPVFGLRGDETVGYQTHTIPSVESVVESREDLLSIHEYVKEFLKRREDLDSYISNEQAERVRNQFIKEGM